MTNPHLAAFVRCTKDDSTDPDMLNPDIAPGTLGDRCKRMMDLLGTNYVVLDRAFGGARNVPNSMPVLGSNARAAWHSTLITGISELARAKAFVSLYIAPPPRGQDQIGPWAKWCDRLAMIGVSELTLDAAGDGSWMNPEGQKHLRLVAAIASAFDITVRCEAFAPVGTVPAAWKQCVNLEGWLMRSWARPQLVEPPPGTLIIHQEGFIIDPAYLNRSDFTREQVIKINTEFALDKGHIYAIGVFSEKEAASYGITP